MELNSFKDELMKLRRIAEQQRYLSKAYLDMLDKIIKSTMLKLVDEEIKTARTIK